MLVTLLTRAPHEGGFVAVAGIGFHGSATWLGPAETAGAQVDVELQIRDEVDWKDVIVVSAAGEHADRDVGLVVRGVVDDVDQYGVLTLRVADGVVLIDTRGEPPLGVVGRTVRFAVRDVEIVPTGV